MEKEYGLKFAYKEMLDDWKSSIVRLNWICFWEAAVECDLQKLKEVEVEVEKKLE